MFGDYLKKLRLSLGLTQSELTAKLNLADEEFSSLDVVTLSRWERGKTKPTLAKCFRVLRCLQNDLSDFYDLLPIPKKENIINDYLELRFNSSLAILASSSYKPLNSQQAQLIIKRPLLVRDDDPILLSLQSLYNNVSYLTKELLEINLYDYQENRRCLCHKFIKLDGEITGHSFSFVYNNEHFDTNVRSKIFHLDLTKSVNYTANKKLALFDYLRYSNNPATCEYMLGSQFKILVKHSNLIKYYHYVDLPEGAIHLERLGFNKVAFDVESDSGKFKLANRSFNRCLYEIDSATLLSKPDIIALIKSTSKDINN